MRNRKVSGLECRLVRWCLCFCVAVSIVAGCSSGDGKILVSGLVKLGDLPLQGATVGFIGNNGGQVAHSSTDATGRFTVRATPGINKVIVNKSPDPSHVADEGSSAASGDEEPVDMLTGVEIDIQPAAQQKRRWPVDQKFASPLTSGFEFDIKEGMADINLMVTAP